MKIQQTLNPRKKFHVLSSVEEKIIIATSHFSLWPNQEDNGVSNAFVDPDPDLSIGGCQKRQKSKYLDFSLSNVFIS